MTQHLKGELQPAFERMAKKKNGPFDFQTNSAEKEAKSLRKILFMMVCGEATGINLFIIAKNIC